MYLLILVFDYLLSCIQIITMPMPFPINQLFYLFELFLAEVYLLPLDLILD